MFAQHRITIIFGVLFALCSYASAFWWGTSESSSPTPYPSYFYQQRVLQGPPSLYPSAPPAPAPLPAVPMGVPLRAGLAPLPAVQRVQLVPCLCPVSPDPDHDRDPAGLAPPAAPAPENLYLKPVSVAAVQNS